MKPKLWFIVALLTICFIYSVSFAKEGHYMLIGSSSYESLFFDTETIRFVEESGETYIEVWIKHQPTVDGAKEYIQERQKDNLTIEGFENFAYYIDHKLYSIDKKSCWIDSIDYAKDGRILDIKYYPKRNWQGFTHGSEGEILWLAVMKYTMDNVDLLKSRMNKTMGRDGEL